MILVYRKKKYIDVTTYLRYILFMTAFSNHIRTVENCYTGSPIDDEAMVRSHVVSYYHPTFQYMD